jgi:hypothetical protein
VRDHLVPTTITVAGRIKMLGIRASAMVRVDLSRPALPDAIVAIDTARPMR